MSFLVIDIGNTRLKWATYSAPDPQATLLRHGAVFLETIDDLSEREWQDLSAPTGVLGCAVAGDNVRRRVEDQLEIWDLEPHWVASEASAGGVSNGYDHPVRLGSDRWVAMVGARHRLLMRGERCPALVVMVGTAVTVDALDADGHFLGGLILPGFGLMLKALEMGTAGLKVPTGELCHFPTNTSDALMSGGAWAIAGAIDRMYAHVQTRCGQAPALFMSGGAAVKLAPMTGLPFEMVDTLIFEGLLKLASERQYVFKPSMN
ncbi:MAG: type III pantothenate kinase [Leptothrix ochracea]|uniref:type III pantothenate kinase n=1 Tax=Leptothrix ochracea TaxID=735331 RepID=UPI0034E1E306